MWDLWSFFFLLLVQGGLYAEGDLAPDRGYLYIAIVYNISIFLALTALMVFYAATKDLLKCVVCERVSDCE